jgi:lysophospholipase L1-like esterase
VIHIAAQQITSFSKVITMDMAAGFNDSYLADDVHYNGAGAAFIANRYFDVLINVLQE